MKNSFFELAKDYEKSKKKKESLTKFKNLYEKEQQVWIFKIPIYFYPRYWGAAHNNL